MTYFEDETAYSYGADDKLVNVGWLDVAHEYPRGAVAEDFVRRLRQLCATGTAKTRGWHRCNLCPRSAPYPVAIAVANDDQYYVGDAEIRVPQNGPVVYAAPTMVIHYVLEHGYRPPAGFIDAVLRS